MHPSLNLLLLLAAAVTVRADPPLHESHYSNHHLRNSPQSPKEYVEVVRPLPTDSLTPTCTIPLLSHTFGNTYGLPPANATYSTPSNCTWTRAVLHLSGASNGSNYDRIAAVWLSGVEILRTSTPEPTPEGIFWNVRKDVTKYSSLLRKSNLTLAIMLENIVNDVYTAVYRVNLTLLFYNTPDVSTAVNSPLSMPPPKNRNPTASQLGENQNPADLIIPISTSGEDGFWFRIQSQSDSVFHGIKLPLNSYRAVIELYVSAHGDDEFWYSNPPDSYFELNHLPKTRSHGSYREVQVKLDDNVVGIVVPYPVIFTGGINPLFWDPVVSIGAFNLPSYEIELTPFLAMLLDGKQHYFGLGVDSALPFWLIDANLHLWIDPHVESVQAGAIQFNAPTNCIERESQFQNLDSKFEIEGESKSEFRGWVSYTAGNITVNVKRKIKFKSSIEFARNGTQKETESKVKESVEYELTDSNWGLPITSSTLDRRYPLKIKTSTEAGSGQDIYLIKTKLKQSAEESIRKGRYSRSNVINSQECDGWMVVQGHDVLSGGAETDQNLVVRDDFKCYRRVVSAADGTIITDLENFLCNGGLDAGAALVLS